MKKFLLLILLLIIGCDEEEIKGCDGIPGSALVLDECGECGGNNSTCLTGYFHKDGRFYKTIDSGVTWVDQGNNHGLNDPDIKGISFVNESTGFFQDEGSFYKTIDSGITWVLSNPSGQTDIEGISFVDDSTGYFHKDGRFYKTIDSGVTWVDQGNNHGLNDPDIKGISFVNESTGFFQDEGSFYKTIDSGITWVLSNPSGQTDIEGISFIIK